MNNSCIIYLGFNSFYKHKRGVENVILFQSNHNLNLTNYYIFWDDTKTHIYKYQNLICIGIKKNKLWLFTFNFLIFKLFSRNVKCFIHSHNPLMSIFCIKKTNLLTVHDPLYYLSVVNKYKYTLFYYFLEKILYLRIKWLHYISFFAKKNSLAPSSLPYEIIYNTSFLENPIANNPTFKKSNLIEVLIVRSIEERARIDLIIELAVSSKNSNYNFTIIGKGPYLEYYNNIIKELGLSNIKMLGFVSDSELKLYYNRSDLVLITSEYGEGFGLPIIEAYLHNKPVIASNKCAIPEIIISNNYLFENNLKSIESKLNQIINQKLDNYYQYYLDNFSNKIIIGQFNILYRKLMSR